MELTENQKAGLIVGIPAALAAILMGWSVAAAKPAAPPGPPAPSVCESGQKQFKTCPDYVTVAEQICQGGQWIPGYQCPVQDIVGYDTPDFFLIDIKNDTLRFQWTTADGGAASSGYSQGYFLNPRNALNTIYGAGWISQTQYSNALLQLQLLGY